jgi:hypothetical protein
MSELATFSLRLSGNKKFSFGIKCIVPKMYVGDFTFFPLISHNREDDTSCEKEVVQTKKRNTMNEIYLIG